MLAFFNTGYDKSLESKMKKHVIAGTNRPGSRSLELSSLIQSLYLEQGEDVDVISLEKVGLEEMNGSHYGSDSMPSKIRDYVNRISESDGLIMVVPEYNGSMPGALKYFIDFWKYPGSFEYRPVCFVGLGGLFGGLRPVEHLQHVFNYRNSFVYPERVFIRNVWEVLREGKVEDEIILQLLKSQVSGFQKFCAALNDSNLHVNKRDS